MIEGHSNATGATSPGAGSGARGEGEEDDGEIRVLYPTLSNRRRRRQRRAKSSSPSASGTGSQYSDVGGSSSERELDRNPLYVALHVAVRANDSAAVESIVKNVTNINVPSLPDYQTPLHVVASLGHTHLIRTLAKHRTFEVGRCVEHSLTCFRIFFLFFFFV